LAYPRIILTKLARYVSEKYQHKVDLREAESLQGCLDRWQDVRLGMMVVPDLQGWQSI